MKILSEKKKVLFGVIAVLVLLVTGDWVVGTISEYMYYKSRYGIYHRQIYCLQKGQEELLILGSSRAAHHYIPQVFIDSLGMTCYNAGSDGMCIYYHYAMLSAYLHRESIPEMVICEVSLSDVEVSQGGTFTLDGALQRLGAHCEEVPEIDSLFAHKGWKELLKLHSKTYRYNSKLVGIIKSIYLSSPDERGYEPLSETMDIELYNKELTNQSLALPKVIIEELKVKYILKLISICQKNNIQLVLCHSPYYGDIPSESVNLIKKLAREHGIVFLEYSRDAQFQSYTLYKDATHLNDTGARMYSKEVAHVLKKYIADMIK